MFVSSRPYVAVSIFVVSAFTAALTMRDLADIRYRFTSCGVTGRLGPSYPTCREYYSERNSPITKRELLFQIDEREYEGSQGFRVPSNGLYNITVAAAGGGQGICNLEQGGFGYIRTIQVELTTDYELLVLVGQRGGSPCDAIPKTDDIYETVCQTPPANVADVENCNETWYNFTRDFHRQFYEAFGGGAGGGGTLVRARRRDTKVFDNFPIVIVGGGGGTPAVLNYDVVEDIGAQNIFLSNHIAYQSFTNGQSRTNDRDHGIAGARGFRFSSATTIAGAGGGFSVGLLQSINVDGGALGRAQDFAEGGFDCTQSFLDAGGDIPYFGVYGGFGGGGGACGGGGGGGGYSGGAVLDVGVTIPGGGGFSYLGDTFSTSFSVNEIGFGLLNRERDSGYVEIILANCGCVYECVMNTTEDQFECLCPNDTQLAPGLSDCFASGELAIIQEPSATIVDGLYYKYVEIQNSSFILSNEVEIQSDNEMCGMFWLGERSQIVLATDVVRGSQRISMLGPIEDDVLDTPLSVLLNTSVLVTGALLVGSGDCSIVGRTISVATSIQDSSTAALSREDFRSINSSAVEQMTVQVAAMIFRELVTDFDDVQPALSLRAIAGIVVAVIMVTLLLATIVCVSVCATVHNRVSKRARPNDLQVMEIPASAFHYKDSLISNLAYSKFEPQTSPTQSPINIPDDHRYEMLAYNSEGEAALSPTEASIAPLHGVTVPKHDFSSFNRQRRNTVIQDWSYPRSNLVYMRELGEGQFGKVLLMKAKDIAGYSGTIPVAVKTLTSRDSDVIQKFYEEADLMKTFSHPNVVSLLSFIREEKDEDSAPLMVLEYMQYGDLSSFLKSYRPSNNHPSVIGERKFCAFASDVARGLEFLSSMKYVHRDIAARNCLVGAGLRIKIADFGLARGVQDKDYYKVGGAAVLPVRWMAPECILYGVFSSASDVWAFGVLLWEIVTYGQMPLGDVSVEEIIESAQNNGIYHPRPPNCPDSLYNLMSNCLENNVEERVEITDVVLYLDKINNLIEMSAVSDTSVQI